MKGQLQLTDSGNKNQSAVHYNHTMVGCQIPHSRTFYLLKAGSMVMPQLPWVPVWSPSLCIFVWHRPLNWFHHHPIHSLAMWCYFFPSFCGPNQTDYLPLGLSSRELAALMSWEDASFASEKSEPDDQFQKKGSKSTNYRRWQKLLLSDLLYEQSALMNSLIW